MTSNVDVMVSPPLFALYQRSRLPYAWVRLGPVSRSDCAWRERHRGDWNTRDTVVSWEWLRKKLETGSSPGAHVLLDGFAGSDRTAWLLLR